MFIKSTYETKLQEAKTVRTQRQPGQAGTSPSMHKKWVIGSNHYGPHKNYQRDFQFFSIDDIPQAKKHAHDEACEFVDPDILGLKKRDWNASIKVPKYPHLEETFERKLTKIKIGLLDHPVQKGKPNKIYDGTDTRDRFNSDGFIGSSGWNVSTSQDLFERKKLLDNVTRHSMEVTSKHYNTLNNYVKPTIYTTNYNEKLRNTKADDQNLRTSIREKYKYENPNASHERVDGAVYRLTYEHKVKQIKPQSENEAANLTFKPDLSVTLKRPRGYNTHDRTIKVLVGSQDVTVGAYTKTEPLFRTIAQEYIISNKKDKTVEDRWQISPEEEVRVEILQKGSKNRHDEHTPTNRD